MWVADRTLQYVGVHGQQLLQSKLSVSEQYSIKPNMSASDLLLDLIDTFVVDRNPLVSFSTAMCLANSSPVSPSPLMQTVR
jgi:hypothetical protein